MEHVWNTSERVEVPSDRNCKLPQPPNYTEILILEKRRLKKNENQTQDPILEAFALNPVLVTWVTLHSWRSRFSPHPYLPYQRPGCLQVPCWGLYQKPTRNRFALLSAH